MEKQAVIVRFTKEEHDVLKQASRELGYTLASLVRQGTLLHVMDLTTPGQTRRVARARRMLRSEVGGDA